MANPTGKTGKSAGRGDLNRQGFSAENRGVFLFPCGADQGCPFTEHRYCFNYLLKLDFIARTRITF